LQEVGTGLALRVLSSAMTDGINQGVPMSSTTHRFFVRLLLGQLALAAILAFPIDAKAQARVGGSDFTFDEREQQREERRESEV